MRRTLTNKHQTRDRSLILITFMSFGESLFTRDHVCIWGKTVLKQRIKVHFIAFCMSMRIRGPHPGTNQPKRPKETHLQPIRDWHMDSRAHNADQIDIIRRQHTRNRARTHLPVHQRKLVVRSPTGGVDQAWLCSQKGAPCCGDCPYPLKVGSKCFHINQPRELTYPSHKRWIGDPHITHKDTCEEEEM